MAVLLAQLILLTTLAVAPWLFGGVRVEAWLAAAVLAALACLSLSRFRRGAQRLAVPVAMLPLLLGLALGAVQLLPLDFRIAAIFSPVGSELREGFQSPTSSVDASLAAQRGAAAPQRQPVSLYPASTRYEISRLILAGSAFFLGATLFHTARAQLWLCFVLAINGAAIAVFGLIQMLTANHLLYWLYRLPPGAREFGPYVNRNNAAGYLTLCLASALGLLIWVMGRSREVPLVSTRFPSPRRPTLAARLKRSVLEFLARLDAGQIVAFSLAACVVAGIVCAISRGAWIATAVAVIVTGIVALGTRRGPGHIAILTLVAVGGLALALWAGTSGPAGDRLTELFDAAHSPWSHWEESSRAVPDFWRLGSGLGTYRHVYGLYEESPRKSWYEHAENQYLETLVEMGVPGLGLLVAMIAVVAWNVGYVLRKESDPGAMAFGVVALFAVTAQVIHAMFDFGLYIPANMLSFAVLCGAVTGRAAQLAAQSRSSRWLTLPRVGLIPLVLAISLSAACAWGFSELRSAAAVRVAVSDVKNRHFDEQTPSGATAAELEAAIERLTAAVENRVDDAEGHSQLGILWTHLYHVRAFEKLQQNQPAETTSAEAALWDQASLSSLHERACLFAQAGQSAAVQILRSQPAVVQNLQPALTHFLLARRYCPLIAESHLGLGALLPLEGDFAGDRMDLERARRLQPTNSAVFFLSGLFDFQAGRLDAAYASWKTSLTLSDEYFPRVLRATWQSLGNLEIVRSVLPDQPRWLIRLTRYQLASEGYEEPQSAVTQRAMELLDQGDLPEDEVCYLRALALENRKEYAEAIESYKQALRLQPRNTVWREEYARLLEGQGRISDAIEQVSLLARMAGDDRRIRTWLWNLHLTLLDNRDRVE